eukprot:UN05987
MGINCGVIHGDKGQTARQQTVSEFRNRKIDALVATDVAARGLDIKGLKTVVNYDSAHNLDAHIHRVGRTGRAGETGTAYSLLAKDNKRDKKFAPILVKVFRKEP